MQFKAVEQNLNKLCSQHDQYMSLLDLVDYLNNIKPLTQNNRLINSKINVLQQSLRDIQDIRLEQNRMQKQQSYSKIQKFKKNIAFIEQKLQTYTSIFADLQKKITDIQKESNPLAYFKDINAVNSNILQIIDKETEAVHGSIALYKNQLQCKGRSQMALTKGIYEGFEGQIQQESLPLQQIIGNTMIEQVQQYDKLAHQLSLFKLSFPIPQLLPFVQHNYQAIRQQTSTLLSIISIHQQSIKEIEFDVIKHQERTLYYRMRALKDYALSQLIKLYGGAEELQGKSKFTVNKVEKEVGGMIRELENRLELLKGFLDKLQPQRKVIKK